MPRGGRTDGQRKDGRLDFFGNRAIKYKWTFERRKTRYLRIKKERRIQDSMQRREKPNEKSDD